MKKYRIAIFIGMLSFLCALFNPLQVMAAYGTILSADITHIYSQFGDVVQLSNTYVRKYDVSTDGNSILPADVLATYEGEFRGILNLYLNSGYYYNGEYTVYLDFEAEDNSNINYSWLSAALETVELGNGIYLSSYLAYESIKQQTIGIRITFENYAASNGYVRIPLNIDLTLSVSCDNSFADVVPAGIVVNCTPDSINGNSYEPVNDVMRYSDIRDLSGYQGDTARQNQQIIDSINQHDSNVGSWFSDIINNLGNWFTEQKTNINTRFSELTSNLTSWYNGLTSTINTRFNELLNQNSEEHEETINGYQGTEADQAEEKFTAGADELESIESDLSNDSNQNIANYTGSAFDTSVIATLGSSLVYVVTWFTNFWNMGGLFTTLLTAGLAIWVAFFIIFRRG